MTIYRFHVPLSHGSCLAHSPNMTHMIESSLPGPPHKADVSLSMGHLLYSLIQWAVHLTHSLSELPSPLTHPFMDLLPSLLTLWAACPTPSLHDHLPNSFTPQATSPTLSLNGLPVQLPCSMSFLFNTHSIGHLAHSLTQWADVQTLTQWATCPLILDHIHLIIGMFSSLPRWYIKIFKKGKKED